MLSPELVARGYRVATFDLRGHGQSDPTSDRYDDAAAADALALVERLGGPAVLLGSSMGAGAAAYAAAERPEAVTDLILLGPLLRSAAGSAALLAMRVLLVRPWGPAAWRHDHATLWGDRPPNDLAQHKARIRRPLARPVYWNRFVTTAMSGHDEVTARLAQVRCGGLVLMGSRDRDVDDPAVEGRWGAEQIGGDLVMVGGAGHYPIAEQTTLVADAVAARRNRPDLGAAAGSA